MHLRVVLLAAIIFACIVVTLPRPASAYPVEDCSAWELQRCSTCLTQTTTCGWCQATGACILGVLGLETCSFGFQFPQGSMTQNSVNSALASSFSPPVSSSVFSPANMTAFLRQGHTYSVEIEVTPPAFTPTDFYFLFDVSSGMFADIENIKLIGSNITEWVSSFANSRIALGAFVDKPIQPFTDPSLSWPPKNVATFNIRHLQSFTSDMNLFLDELNGIPISGDFDGPHSGLEALAQISLCTSELGWRANARKVAIMFTNEGYHTAMDGARARLEASFSPTCALSVGTSFQASLDNSDYPTINQFASALKSTGVIPMFAIPGSIPHLEWAYGKQHGVLSKLGYGEVIKVKDNYSDLIRRLDVGFKEIINYAILYSPSDHSLIRSITPKSLLDATGTKTGNSVNVTVELFTPKRITLPETISLVAVGHIASFPITVRDAAADSCTSNCLAVACQNNCSGRGTCECGRCVNCTSPFGGVFCGRVETATCGSDSTVCNGHGVCEGFGRCKCDAGWGHTSANGVINDNDCRCSLTLCPVGANGQVCSGLGYCDCGVCKCHSGYQGLDCSCQSDATCSPSANCNGRGTCACGKCQCAFPWRGPSCSECSPDEPDCPIKRTSPCDDFQLSCDKCVSFSDDAATNKSSCYWCNDVKACLPTGTEQTCREVLNNALIGDCPCLVDCDSDIYLKYESSNEKSYSFSRFNKTQVGPIIGIILGCVFLMALVVVVLVKMYVNHKNKQDWKRYYAVSDKLQKGEFHSKDTSGLVSNPLFNKKGGKNESGAPPKKKKTKASGSDSESERDRPRKKKTKPKKRYDSDSD